MDRTARPVIGVSGPDKGGGAAWPFTRLGVWMAGGLAVRIRPGSRHTVDEIDGLILGGGADVDPVLYGCIHEPFLPPKPPEESIGRYILSILLNPLVWLVRRYAATFTGARIDKERDELERTLIEEAIARGIPILGICRGEQLLNVYFGGSLYQALKSFYVEDPEIITIFPRKMVSLESGSQLAAILGPEPRRVNALHRQGVNRLGTGLKVTARDRNGIIQAIEHESLPFIIGVQWHPEYLPQLKEQRALFGAIVDRARQVIKRPKEIFNLAPTFYSLMSLS